MGEEVIESQATQAKTEPNPALQPTPSLAHHTGPKTISRSEIDKKADDIIDSRRLPKTPGVSANLEQVDAWFKLISPDMLSRLKGYLYRLHPVIVRKLADPEAPKHIDVL